MEFGTIGVFLNTKEQRFVEMNVTSTENNAGARLAALAAECERVEGSILNDEVINQLQFKLDQIIDLNAWASQASVYIDSMKKMLSLKKCIEGKQHWSTDEITLAQKDIDRCSLQKLKEYFHDEIQQLKKLYNYASYEEINLNEPLTYSFMNGISGNAFLKKIETSMNESYKAKISLVKEYWLKNVLFENQQLQSEEELVNILHEKNRELDNQFTEFKKATSIEEIAECFNGLVLISYNRQNRDVQHQVAQAIYAKKEDLKDYNDLFKWSAIFVMRFSRKEEIKTETEELHEDLLQKVVTSDADHYYSEVLTFN